MKNTSEFLIKKSRNGRGVFVTKSYRASDRLFEIEGEVIKYSKSEDIKREVVDDYFRLGKFDYIDPQKGLAFFVNHSCRPNARIEKGKGRLYMTAITDLKSGDEVYIDYTTNSAMDDTWFMKCNCGDTECRGLVGNIGDLPKDILTKYVKLKIIPRYILSINSNGTRK